MNLLFLASIIIFALITAYNIRFGVYLILILIPAFLLRAQIALPALGKIPTTFLELAIYLLAIVWLFKKINHNELQLHYAKSSRRRDELITTSYKQLIQPIKLFLLPALFFLAAAIISTIISPDKRLSLGILKAWFFDPLLFTIILIDQIKTQKHLNKVIACLSFMILWVSGYGIYEYFFNPKNLVEYLRLDSIFTSANYVTMLAVPITVLLLGYLISNLKQYNNITIQQCNNVTMKQLPHCPIAPLLIFTTAISLTAVYLTRSYSGWLGLIVGVFMLITFSPLAKKAKLLFLAALLVFFGFFLYTQKDSPKFQTLFNFNSRTSSHSRLQIWQTSLAIIKDHPILGIGLGNFHSAYIKYLPKTVAQPLEYEVLKPHNLYLNLWLETGLLGLLAFIWLIIVFYKNIRNKKTNDKCQMINDKYICISAMTALLTQALFDTPYFKNDLSLIFWLLIGLAIINTNNQINQLTNFQILNNNK